MPPSQKNGRAAWARVAVLISIIVLLVGIGAAWGKHQGAIENHDQRITQAEERDAEMTRVLTELRIETGKIRVILERMEAKTKPEKEIP